ncbi:MAG: hypothetical protein AAF960_25315 [Bacteroidota bacterium]
MCNLTASGDTTAQRTVVVNNTASYQVTITFDDRCTGTQTFPVRQLPPVELYLDKVEPTCLANGNDGQIIIESDSIIDGVAIEYRLEGDSIYTTNRVFDSLAAGNYTVFARYQGFPNCEASDPIALVSPSTTHCDSTVIQIATNTSDTTICQGASVTLIVTGATSYTWSNGATSSSITVQPDVTTTYQVVGRSDGKEGIAYVQVKVTDLAAEISESIAICAGESILLDAYSPIATNYLWSNGDTNRVISVMPDRTTTYTVTVGDETCAEVVTTTVTVLTDSILVEPSRLICEGDSTILMATGGVAYEWMEKGTTTVLDTTAFLTVRPSSETAYQVKITSQNGCVGISEYPVLVRPTIPLAVQKTNPTCDNNQQDGSISITSPTTIDNQDLEFSLSADGVFSENITFDGLLAGDYTLLARYKTDTTCVTSLGITLLAPTNCTACNLVLTAEVTPPSCPQGTDDGVLTLMANDTLATIEYKLNNGNWTSGISQFSNLSPATYTVYGRTTTNPDCITNIEVVVPEPLQPCDCDTIPPTLDCNANLVAGDIAIIGFDNDIGGDVDQILLTNLVDLMPGTSFSLTTAIYGQDTLNGEWWTAPDGTPNVAMQTIVYDGVSSIPAGSILCLELPASGVGEAALAHRFTINGQTSEDFCVYHTGIQEGPVNLRTDAPTSLFVVQGQFEVQSGQADFCGNVLAGLLDGGTWQLPATHNPIGSQVSTVHPHLDCFYVQGSPSAGANAAYYNGIPAPPSADAYDILSALVTYDSWVKGGDIPPEACTQTIQVPNGE